MGGEDVQLPSLVERRALVQAQIKALDDVLRSLQLQLEEPAARLGLVGGGGVLNPTPNTTKNITAAPSTTVYPSAFLSLRDENPHPSSVFRVEEKVNQVIQLFDEDGDGELCHSEFASLLIKLEEAGLQGEREADARLADTRRNRGGDEFFGAYSADALGKESAATGIGPDHLMRYLAKRHTSMPLEDCLLALGLSLLPERLEYWHRLKGLLDRAAEERSENESHCGVCRQACLCIPLREMSLVIADCCGLLCETCGAIHRMVQHQQVMDSITSRRGRGQNHAPLDHLKRATVLSWLLSNGPASLAEHATMQPDVWLALRGRRLIRTATVLCQHAASTLALWSQQGLISPAIMGSLRKDLATVSITTTDELDQMEDDLHVHTDDDSDYPDGVDDDDDQQFSFSVTLNCREEKKLPRGIGMRISLALAKPATRERVEEVLKALVGDELERLPHFHSFDVKPGGVAASHAVEAVCSLKTPASLNHIFRQAGLGCSPGDFLPEFIFEAEGYSYARLSCTYSRGMFGKLLEIYSSSDAAHVAEEEDGEGARDLKGKARRRTLKEKMHWQAVQSRWSRWKLWAAKALRGCKSASWDLHLSPRAVMRSMDLGRVVKMLRDTELGELLHLGMPWKVTVQSGQNTLTFSMYKEGEILGESAS
jgi:hypothetical protein